MKNTLRMVTILLCLTLTVGMAACGTDSGSAQPNTSSAAPTATPKPTAAPKPTATPKPTAAPAQVAGLNADNYPRVDGSTANLPLIAEVYSRVCGVSREDGEALAQVSGTADAWDALANGRADLLIVYEAPDSVKQELGQQYDRLLDIKPVGRDGLVFLVNGRNKVGSLTQEQLRSIYTGKATDWGAVGGDAGAISPFQRNEDSGSQTMFLKLLMGDVKPMNPPTELVSGAMGSLIDSVAAYDGGDGAIGYSVYYYAQEMYKNPDLKLLSVDGIAPANETIGDGSYPLVNEFFVAIRANEPSDSPARLLRDWLLTDAGREALTAAGYVAIA